MYYYYYYYFFLFFISTISLLSLLFISFSLYKPTFVHKPKTTTNTATAFSNDPQKQTAAKPQETERSDPDDQTDPTHLTLEILPSDTELGPGQKKKRKKRKKKDKSFNNSTDSRSEEEEKEKEKEKRLSGLVSGKPDLVCLYPFTSSGSATQRRIKQHFDQLVKCNESKGLTLAQVGEFANCLIEARNELQHKSEVIQRKFTITKALLLKADRSSFDRLRQQIYKLELEQKRLEEDAFVYNWLQQQLKLSPAYKKMLEISSSMELKAQSSEVIETEDSEFPDISFEELLAQEKKDSFWQKMGKSRSCSG